MMASGDTGTVLITGPTSGLGRALTLELAGRAESDRPDLLLVGRPGERLTEITSLVRAGGATAEAIPCDLSRLSDVRDAAAAAKELLATGAVRPRCGAGLIARLAGLARGRVSQRVGEYRVQHLVEGLPGVDGDRAGCAQAGLISGQKAA